MDWAVTVSNPDRPFSKEYFCRHESAKVFLEKVDLVRWSEPSRDSSVERVKCADDR